MSVESFREKYATKSSFSEYCYKLRLGTVVSFSEMALADDIKRAIGQVKKQINKKIDEALQELEREK